MGTALGQQRSFKPALALFERAAACYTRAHGADHAKTQQARALAQQLRSEGALEYTVVAVQGRPELNGRRGQLRSYDEAKGRYVVRFAGDGVAPARLRPHNVLLPRGTRVVLRGLQGAPELNGREGVALEHDDVAGRYAVRLDGGEARSVKVKRENAVAKL